MTSSATRHPGFVLETTAFTPGGRFADAQLFNGMGYSGGNLSPALSWRGAPPGTKSYALMMHDPDAPTGSGWWHWVVYDIPADVAALPAGAGAADGSKLPAGAKHGVTDFGTAGYGGAAPPKGHGVHHYDFRLFALGVPKIDPPPGATAAMIGFMVNANALAVAYIQATYGS